MRRSRYVLAGCLVLMSVFVAERALGRSRRPAAPPTTPNEASTSTTPKVQVAILLDVSGSMSGLLQQTRAELWGLVSELGKVRSGDKRPRLEMALYTYGRAD